MKNMLRLFLISMLALALLPACSEKKEGEAKEGSEAAAEEEVNPFQVRKDSIESYMKVIDDAPDAEAALAAGQTWLDANLEAYKTNCDLLIVYRADLKKSKMGKGIKTPLDGYTERINTKAGGPLKAGPLMKQFHSFFNCDVLKNQ